jgi:hypothetical protein
MKRLNSGALAAFALMLNALPVNAGAEPVSPYKVLGVLDTVEPSLKSPPVTRITAGGMSIQLEVTPLRAVQRRFGGVIRHAGDAGDAVTFLCFVGRGAAGAPVTYWFTSNDEMSGGHDEIGQVAVQTGATARVLAACAKAPPALMGVDFGIPSIGSPLAAVTRHFAGGRPNRAGQLSYANEHPAKGSSESRVLQSVGYLFRAGVVTAISVSRVTYG